MASTSTSTSTSASTGKSLHFSDSFVISCGTVTIDTKTSKVLLIRWRKTGEVFLPKGRKDVNESLDQTALRETYEETGSRVQLLPVPITTLATSPSSLDSLDESAGLTASTEPIAVAQRVTNGTLKIIFWYVASGDSTAAPQDRPQQQENEDFDTLWVPFDETESTLSFDDDQRIARTGIDAARKTATTAAAQS
ncbi:NUDIX hydrolase domain-like protein [Xylaria cf. heliscus]|nr:NUDIX hydrolase domain-like protein [Xylaria cf. heliscus]